MATLHHYSISSSSLKLYIDELLVLSRLKWWADNNNFDNFREESRAPFWLHSRVVLTVLASLPISIPHLSV